MFKTEIHFVKLRMSFIYYLSHIFCCNFTNKLIYSELKSALEKLTLVTVSYPHGAMIMFHILLDEILTCAIVPVLTAKSKLSIKKTKMNTIQ